METVELIGRVIIALVVVVGLIYLIGKKARGGVRRKLRTDKLIDVLGRQALAKGSSVAVVRVAGHAMILGVTDQQVRLLREIELDEVGAVIAAPADDAITVPADAADLDGTLTSADLEELRTARGSVINSSAKPSVPRQAAGLSGSALSPATWRQTLDALRELTVRKG